MTAAYAVSGDMQMPGVGPGQGQMAQAQAVEVHGQSYHPGQNANAYSANYDAYVASQANGGGKSKIAPLGMYHQGSPQNHGGPASVPGGYAVA